MTSERDRPDGDYSFNCAECHQRFSGYKSDRLCMVCLKDAHGAAAARAEAAAEDVAALRRDKARLDWLDTQPYIVIRDQNIEVVLHRDRELRINRNETVREAVDKAMKEQTP